MLETGCFMRSIRWSVLLVAPFIAVAGCRDDEKPKADTVESGSGAKSPVTNPPKDGPEREADGDRKKTTAARRKPIFGGENSTGGANTTTTGENATSSGSPKSAKEQLQKLQVIVGSWKGLPQLRNKPTAKLETPQAEWRWDFSRPGEPALVYESDSKHYHKSARLTYDPKAKAFQLLATDEAGKSKTYRGTFSKQIHDFSEDGKTMERSFTLTFTQVQPAPKTREDDYQIELQQLRNNRHLLIVSHKRGSSLRPGDRMANQRTGTSFAAKLDDYGEKTCVVSQGLGTTPVSHNGKTYYVCCSGCKKAFEEEPAKWIASFEKWKRERGK